ncbi:MAG: hypothetical protein MZV63_34150 [Marinilabiliales bacterium]|nr:hypothetical protein [Marinilabiliales bacterium]
MTEEGQSYIDTDIMYENMMNRFKWGMPKIHPFISMRQLAGCSVTTEEPLGSFAQRLVIEGDTLQGHRGLQQGIIIGSKKQNGL